MVPVILKKMNTPKDQVPTTYLNKDGKHIDIATGKVIELNMDGSLNKRGAHLTPAIREKGLKAAHAASHKMSIYTGDSSGENWEKLFGALTENPMLLAKAVASVGFTMTAFNAHLTQNPALKQRFDLIQESNLDEYEQNMHKIANLPINDESKALPTILRANETRLNASAKSRGYGIKQNAFNVEGDMQINIINNTQVSLPGQE